ncbi:hypothetical protein C7M84_003665 [Penaeus vannamei]|uniref:Uncharacterized protein n=1 Tax=Penaeus vannamei TaxID=6689 RepID=A0A3R7QG06_PENVA|nr:hypothetical protein C7M84_003665 [Penaeus vannamei]
MTRPPHPLLNRNSGTRRDDSFSLPSQLWLADEGCFTIEFRQLTEAPLRIPSHVPRSSSPCVSEQIAAPEIMSPGKRHLAHKYKTVIGDEARGGRCGRADETSAGVRCLKDQQFFPDEFKPLRTPKPRCKIFPGPRPPLRASAGQRRQELRSGRRVASRGYKEPIILHLFAASGGGGGVGGARGNFSRARYAPRQHAAPALLTWTCLHTFIESANFSQQRLTHHAKGQVNLVLTYPRPPFRSPPRLLRRLHQALFPYTIYVLVSAATCASDPLTCAFRCNSSYLPRLIQAAVLLALPILVRLPRHAYLPHLHHLFHLFHLSFVRHPPLTCPTPQKTCLSQQQESLPLVLACSLRKYTLVVLTVNVTVARAPRPAAAQRHGRGRNVGAPCYPCPCRAASGRPLRMS